MNLTIKTLKGGKFIVDVEASNTVAQVKEIIEKEKSDLAAPNMKLIHSGKVLKDDVAIESCNIKPNDFLVCMITKAKKSAAAKPAAPAPAPAAAPLPRVSTPPPPTTSAPPAPAPTATATTPAPTTTSSSTTAPTPATPAPAAPTTAAPPAPTQSSEFPTEVVSNLTSMGFPEAEVRACLRASNGNPDVAVEFLMNGIPPSATLPSPMRVTPSSTGGGASGEPLAALRNHPQFDALRRLVQSNPSTLQAVLTQIGQQQPELLQEINSNQAAFLQMMNEPILESSTPGPTATPTTGGAAVPATTGAPGGANPNLRAYDMTNPAQMAQMLSSLSPPELNEMAAMMGISPDQLTAMAQMIGQMGNQDQFQEYLQAMQGGGAGGAGGAAGGAGGHVLRLTEEEMAAVDRLTEMGFDRAEAAQAFLACDKNEALAANLLMDSAGEGGFGGFSGGGGGDQNGGDDAEDMYD